MVTAFRFQSCREDRRLTRLLQLARLHVPACAEDIDFRTPRGLDKGVMLRLASCAWVRNNEVVLIK